MHRSKTCNFDIIYKNGVINDNPNDEIKYNLVERGKKTICI